MRKIFLTSFLQIGLVAINTFLITKLIWVGIFIVSFLISWLWALNVSKISVSTKEAKLVYAFGAGCGAISGLLLLNLILKTL
jgi:hypothetical protein